MFIEQSVTPENKFWKYILGAIIIIVASVIGQLPLLMAVLAKSVQDGGGFPTSELALMKTLDSNLTLFLLLLASAFAIAGIYLSVRLLHKQRFSTLLTSRPKPDLKRIWFAFALWGFFSVASTLLDYFSNPEEFIMNFKPVPFLILLVISIVMVPIQTSSEEFIFRGYLMQGFGNLARNKWLPLVLTSVIFGLLHIANPEVDKMGYVILVYYIGTGFFLGIITLMDEGMELSLGFHAANNLAGALLVTADWSAFQTNALLKDISEPAVLPDIIVPVAIAYPLMLFIFSRKYRWSNWKEKLTGKITQPLIQNPHEQPNLPQRPQ